MKVGAENLLHFIDLFADLDVETTNRIGQLCTWLKPNPRQTVVDQSDMSSDVFFVTEGLLSVTLFSKQGKEVGYSQIGRGDTFGEFSAIDGSRRSASIVTLQDSVLAKMKGAAFRDLIAQNPILGLRLCELLVAKNRQLTRRVFELSVLSVPNRIAGEILRIARKQSKDSQADYIAHMPTHYQIASNISTNREAVSRTLSKLAREGIIEMQSHSLTILDVSKLTSKAGLGPDQNDI